jgi:hypothetical protein
MGLPGSIGARRVDVTEETDTLADHGYASAFEVITPGTDARSPEQWARAAFEDGPAPIRWFVLIGWRYVLGFRLGPRPSSDHVLGWKIVETAPDSIVLELRSALVIARKVVRVEGARVVMTTFVRYRRPRARALWSAVAPIHHLTEPYLLGRAAAHLASG